jgi:hypothetical protein
MGPEHRVASEGVDEVMYSQMTGVTQYPYPPMPPPRCGTLFRQDGSCDQAQAQLLSAARCHAKACNPASTQRGVAQRQAVLWLAVLVCAQVAKGKPVVTWNIELDTLRGDLGLVSFPPKDLQYR